MKHTLNILVNNHPGVMSHVSGLFARRGYNIDSIAVGTTDNPEFSTMTIVINGNEEIVQQVQMQLLKLPDVLKVTDLFYMDAKYRELVLVSLEVKDTATRQDIISIANVFKAKIIDMSHESLLIEFTGNPRQVETLLELLKKYGIKEISRAGIVALPCHGTV